MTAALVCVPKYPVASAERKPLDLRRVWSAVTSVPRAPMSSVRVKVVADVGDAPCSCARRAWSVWSCARRDSIVAEGDEGGEGVERVQLMAARVLGPTCPYPAMEVFWTMPFCICHFPTAAFVSGPKLPVTWPVYPALSRRNSCRRETSGPLALRERVRVISVHETADAQNGVKSRIEAIMATRRVTSLL